MIRLRLDIAYDGQGFSGWARQERLRTVQGELERVLAYVVGAGVELTCAGRTDAGVHARGQVVHVDVPFARGDVDVARVNRALPGDIRVTRITVAPDGFDARFAALWRRYSYRVCDTPAGPDPLGRRITLAWGKPLDLQRMNEAAALLLGEHDFAPYCRARPQASTVRELKRLDWERDSGGDAVMTVQADAFCHSMVRSLAGAMLPVGDGRRPAHWPADVLLAGKRDPAVTVMPAHPLVLEEVGYPEPGEYRNRQAQTRRVRAEG
ncbi:MAG: tRNA pseudouridine(38-40) synthase TruA [Actinomycetota bacterium]|nr:tRNA pseudouridine(38-40) synthase TruA [Actinomycetota bacterium]